MSKVKIGAWDRNKDGRVSLIGENKLNKIVCPCIEEFQLNKDLCGWYELDLNLLPDGNYCLTHYPSDTDCRPVQPGSFSKKIPFYKTDRKLFFFDGGKGISIENEIDTIQEKINSGFSKKLTSNKSELYI